MPGRINQAEFKSLRTGVFYGQCSEICGVHHSFMPINVEVNLPEEFDLWLRRFASADNVDVASEDDMAGLARAIAKDL